jgi:hypothetical protein
MTLRRALVQRLNSSRSAKTRVYVQDLDMDALSQIAMGVGVFLLALAEHTTLLPWLAQDQAQAQATAAADAGAVTCVLIGTSLFFTSLLHNIDRAEVKASCCTSIHQLVSPAK